ncbi:MULTISPECIES: sensor histidine kinase [Methanobacterium]|uniref:Histidine kinase n=2 Tax=Methanobacterium veterum TaxID=408577 RepID=A0A9E5A2L6_9EURY|nr:MULTISPECIES: histidine kinase N-terminal 7TM domain-containing protein [Methanobacterium]MCZ3372335.1 histidine kinase [Methanobacterium veterum]
MNFQYSPYGAILMVSAFIILSLGIYSYKKRSSTLHTYFIFFMISIFLWCLGAGMEFFSIAIWAKVFWIKVTYFGVATVAPLWFIFVLNYANYEKYLKPTYIRLLFLIPAIIIIMAFTNEWHGLLWPNIIPTSSQPGAVLIYEHGPIFFINMIYSFSLTIIGLIILIKTLIKSSRKYRQQISILIMVGLIPLIFSSLYAFHVLPIVGLDFSPFALVIAGMLLALSIFKFHFLDILPVAHKILFKNMVNGVLVFDDNEKLMEVNSAASLIGISQEDINRNADEVFGKFEELKSVYMARKSESEVFLGEPLNQWIQAQITPIYDDEDIFQGHLLIIQDINKRKKLEDELKKSLEEKDLMMKEIHHRVKNNFMIIQSLLQLQSRHINDEDVLEIFKESQNRIKSMAFVHQRLYQHDNLKKINFGDYPETLASDIFKSYVSKPDQIILDIDTEDVALDIDTAIPLGLILNELISNSLKYAFSDGRNGRLMVKSYLKGSKYGLIVSDDGIGLPEGLDYKKSDSLGLKLIHSLSDQIGADVKLDTTNGTKFEITFEVKN